MGASEPLVIAVAQPWVHALDVDGWRLGLTICKDTGVPQHATAGRAAGQVAVARIRSPAPWPA